jgi:hypothetical protein
MLTRSVTGGCKSVLQLDDYGLDPRNASWSSDAALIDMGQYHVCTFRSAP